MEGQQCAARTCQLQLLSSGGSDHTLVHRGLGGNYLAKETVSGSSFGERAAE